MAQFVITTSKKKVSQKAHINKTKTAESLKSQDDGRMRSDEANMLEERCGEVESKIKQSPSIVRTRHSAGTTRSRETGIDSNDRNRLPRLSKFHMGFFPRRKVHWQCSFVWRYCTSFKQILPVSGPKMRKCFPTRIWFSVTAKHKWYCCQITSLLAALRSNSRGHHNGLGISFL